MLKPVIGSVEKISGTKLPELPEQRYLDLAEKVITDQVKTSELKNSDKVSGHLLESSR